MGRWTQQDSIFNPMDPQLWNWYAYVGNDPVNYTDPSGHKGCSALEIGGAGLAAELAYAPAHAVEFAKAMAGKGPYSGTALYGALFLARAAVVANVVGFVVLGVIAYAVWKKCH